MSRAALGAICGLVLLAGAAAAQDKGRPKINPDAIPGYKVRTVEGFTAVVSDEALKEDAASKLDRKPLEVLGLELKTLSGLMPPKTLTGLKSVAIWVEWDEEVKFSNGRPGRALATYYGGHQLDLLAKGMNPLKAKNITIHRLKSLAVEHQPNRDSGRCVVLHEMTHAVQDQVLGNDNANIKAAYKQALERKLLEKESYAATNEREFFAEMTCAYFDQLDYYPRTHDDLAKHDPVTFKLMETIWGKRKSGASAKGPRGAPAPDLLLERVRLGSPAAGPKVAAGDLKGRPVLLVFWNTADPSSLTFLNKLKTWDTELADFGLVTVGVHVLGRGQTVKVADAARAHSLRFAVTETNAIDLGVFPDFKQVPVALVFGRDGRCAYRGAAFDAEEAARVAVGEALLAKAGVENPPKGLAPVVDGLRQGKAPPSLLPRLAGLTRSPDADTAAAAKTFLDTLTESGRKAIEEARAMAKDDPVAAFEKVEHVPAVYKETDVAAKAADLIARLKDNRAVAAELRARHSLATVQKIDTELGSRPGSFDPAQERFRKENALLLRQLEEGVATMKKSWPKAHATEEAVRIADKYGLGTR